STFFFFFFSSRRRHTRFSRDWSSDVCSSDLASAMVFVVDDDAGVRASIRLLLKSVGIASTPMASAREFLDRFDPAQPGCLVLDKIGRRRVGKEGGSRGAGYHANSHRAQRGRR